MGFTPGKSVHAECGGVYISANPITLSAKEIISSTLNNGAKNRNRIKSFIKKSNSKLIREETTTIVTSLAIIISNRILPLSVQAQQAVKYQTHHFSIQHATSALQHATMPAH